MKIFRKIVIVILIVINIGLIIYPINMIKEPPSEIETENVTIVEAREQTKSEEHPDFIVEEFVLILPEGENVAEGKKVKASSMNDVYGARNVTDGKTSGASYWEGGADYPNLLTVDLEEETKIHAIRLCLNPLPIWGKRKQTIAVNISLDGEHFEELVGTKEYVFDPATGNEVQIKVNNVVAAYVQLIITSNTGAGGGQIAEFEVYKK